MNNSLQKLAKSHGLEFKDCGKGHIQISGRGILVNYYPESKKKSMYCQSLDVTEKNCTPMDVIDFCLGHAKKTLKPRKRKATRKVKAMKLYGGSSHGHTNPAVLLHFYNGDIPPWELPGDFSFNTESDAMRFEAYQLQVRAESLRAQANQLDRM